MSYSVIPTPKFKKEAKRLIKKYPSLKAELLALHQTLSEAPTLGTPLGHHAYKIRLAIKSKGKGKSGGARIISYVLTADKEVFLLTIYDKAEVDTIDDRELRTIIGQLKT